MCVCVSIWCRDLYEFLALNCRQSAVEVEVAYKYVNPGGEHLSTTMIPFKPMSLALACIWGPISVAWCINYALNRRFANVLFLSIGLSASAGWLCVFVCLSACVRC